MKLPLIGRAALFAAALTASVARIDAAQGEAPPSPGERVSLPEMTAVMQMDDKQRTGRVLLDQLEWRDSGSGGAAVWEGFGWYGGDYSKLWLRTEGARLSGATQGARVELLWDRIITRWWSVQTGVREDFGSGPSRGWVAVGIQGRAPYGFDVEATAYVGDAGRTAARLKVEYDLLLTQRCIVQPQAEMNLYGRPDPGRRLGSGLSDLDAGLRVRYEFRREFAPYAGIAWRWLAGSTADYARTRGFGVSELQFVVGVRLWF